MKSSTFAKVGLVTLVSCTAHAALLVSMPGEDDSAKIQGGSVSVQFSSTGGGPGGAAHPLHAPEVSEAEVEETPVPDQPEEPLVEPVSPPPESPPEPTSLPEPEPERVAEQPPEPLPSPTPVSTPTPVPVATPQPARPFHHPVHPHPPTHTASPHTELEADDAVEPGAEGRIDSENAESGEDQGVHGTDDVNTADAASAQGSEIQTEQATSNAAGNAAEMNFAGEVMRHLSRVRRPRASSPGSAFVSFTLTDDGRISESSISQSSGSGRFDRDALTVVNRAAPYPKPPPGVNRTFVVEIEGR